MPPLIKFRRLCFTVISGVMLCGIAGCETELTSDNVVETYIEKWVEFYPSRAFSEGLKPAAGRFENFSDGRVKAWLDYNHDLANRLPATLNKLSLAEKTDLQTLLRKAQMEIERWEQDRVLHHQPQWYAEIISQALTYLLVSETLSPEEKLHAVLKRLEGIEALSTLGIKKLNNASPQKTLGALHTLDQVAVFYDVNLPKLMRSWATEDEYDLIKSATGKAAWVVRSLAQHIRNTVLPHATIPDSYGREAYARKLKIRTGGAVTPEELASLALAEVDRVRDMMVAEASQWWDVTQGNRQGPENDQTLLKAAIDAMENDRVDNNQDLLTLFTDLTAQAERFVRDQDLATVPQPTTLYIALSPDHFSGAAVGGVYPTGPFAPEANTLFYLPSVPEDAPDKQREGFYRSFNNHFNTMIISHEMFPGHYLQYKVGTAHAPKIRSLFADGTYVEGWGSFSELIMLDAGWAQNNHLTRLAHLRKRLENATRAYVSVMVHAGGWDQEKLMDFAITRGLLAPQFAINLWSRVINTPLQLPTYFMGFHGFSKLMAEEKARLGNDFSIRDFVDGILRAGPIDIEALGPILQHQNRKR